MNQSPDYSSSSFFFCTTPLQARICIELIKIKKLKYYSVFYITRNNTVIDHNYFKKLSSGAMYSQIIYIKPKIKGINKLITLLHARKANKYWIDSNIEDIYIASLDNVLFRYIITKHPQANLFSFDDGSANFNTSSLYHNPNNYKGKFLESALRIISITDLKKRLVKHYSIFPSFDNILPSHQVEYVTLFKEKDKYQTNIKTISFFIGQPFEEYLQSSQVDRIISWLNENHVDYYIKHPRESDNFASRCNIPILDTEGKTAEDAIFEMSKGFRPRIIACYSTVLFNISKQTADKIYLSIPELTNEKERINLIEKTGSEIIDLY